MKCRNLCFVILTFGGERARERKLQGTKWPEPERAKGPGSELATILLADLLQGANRSGSEKARYQTMQAATQSQKQLRVTVSACIASCMYFRHFSLGLYSD